MGLVGGLIAASTALNAVNSATSAYSQSRAMKMQGQYQENQLNFNSKLAELQAEDATIRGNKEADIKRKQTKQVIASQRAALAAQGIEVNEDTALQIQQDTAGLGAEDVQTIKNNAWREAWGYKVQALDYSGQAKYAKNSAKFNSRQTILTGGLSFARDVTSGALAYQKYKES